ncbi:MAG: precorrin-2 C(20)-methyltransferase [Cyanobacteria bacterium P01_F01_bin.42]
MTSFSTNDSSTGCLYGISAGPGDPELISVKGLKYLQASPVVAFPAGVRQPQGIAQAIVSNWLQPDQIQLSLHFPMVSNPADWRSAWQDAAEQTWQYLAKGMDVAFVSEGDVSFYSTFTYLAHTLRQQHPELITEAIAGVCSPLAAAAALDMPLTVMNDRLAVLPAIYGIDELPTLRDWADVLVLMKVGSVYQQVWEQLHRLNLLSVSALVIQASQPQQKIVKNLTHHQDLSPPYFSLLVVRLNPNSVLSGVSLQ